MRCLIVGVMMCLVSACGGYEENSNGYASEGVNVREQFNRVSGCEYTEWVTNDKPGLLPVITINDTELSLAVRFLGGHTNNVYIKVNDDLYSTVVCTHNSMTFNCAAVSISYEIGMLVYFSTVVPGVCPEQISAVSVVR